MQLCSNSIFRTWHMKQNKNLQQSIMCLKEDAIQERLNEGQKTRQPDWGLQHGCCKVAPPTPVLSHGSLTSMYWVLLSVVLHMRDWRFKVLFNHNNKSVSSPSLGLLRKCFVNLYVYCWVLLCHMHGQIRSAGALLHVTRVCREMWGCFRGACLSLSHCQPNYRCEPWLDRSREETQQHREVGASPKPGRIPERGNQCEAGPGESGIWIKHQQ